MRPSYILAVIIIILAFFSCGSMIMNVRQQQTVQDGVHLHPYLESQIAQVRIEANSTNARQATQIAGLQATQQTLPSPTLITTSPTKTVTPQSTFPTPTIEDARTPSQTPFPTFTPTRTATAENTQIATSTARPSATSSLSPGCRANGDFVPNTTINRRNAPSLSGTIIQPQLIAGRIEVVCIETQINADGYRWIRVAETPDQEFFVIGKFENGVFTPFGTITEWRP